jgi:hypothetical protein
MAFQDYAKFDALGLADLVAKRDVSPAELVEEAIARVERHNPKINAVVFKTFDRARSAAKLPVQGPFAACRSCWESSAPRRAYPRARARTSCRRSPRRMTRRWCAASPPQA